MVCQVVVSRGLSCGRLQHFRSLYFYLTSLSIILESSDGKVCVGLFVCRFVCVFRQPLLFQVDRITRKKRRKWWQERGGESPDRSRDCDAVSWARLSDTFSSSVSILVLSLGRGSQHISLISSMLI